MSATPLSLFLPLLSIVMATAGAMLPGDARAEPPGGQVLVPDSSVEQPDYIGRKAHTNIKIFVPTGGTANLQPGDGSFYETPASLGCIYGLVPNTSGNCNPTDLTLANPIGGAKALAIVDAYDYPAALSDLQAFSAQFGLVTPNLQVVYASGTKPTEDSGWGLEAALDIEWAHAMAPFAKIYLVEAASNSFADLLSAVTMAGNLVAAAGGGEISMSWGGSEFTLEKLYDSYFTKASVVYFGSAGDGPGVIWPSASPNVVSAGGTTVSRDPSNGNFVGETVWSSTGGGPSKYEARPGYQSVISQIVGKKRGTPDAAADANPTSGVWVYNTPYCGGWCIVGGTSVAAPVWAGIVNSAGKFDPSTSTELTAVYGNLGNPSDFNDIISGTCGPNAGYFAKTGWDFCTGVGSAFGKNGK